MHRFRRCDADRVDVDDGVGISRDGLSGCGTLKCEAYCMGCCVTRTGVDENVCSSGGVNRNEVGRHGIGECGAGGVDCYVTGIGVDRNVRNWSAVDGLGVRMHWADGYGVRAYGWFGVDGNGYAITGCAHCRGTCVRCHITV